MSIVYVPLEKIEDNPFQSRQYYDPDSIEGFADSIEQVGMVQTPRGRVMRGRHVLQPADVRVFHRTAEPAAGAGGLAGYTFLHTPGSVVQLAVGHRRLRAHRAIEARGAGDLVARSAKGAPPGHMAVEIAPLTDAEMSDFEIEENDKRAGLSDVEKAEGWAKRVAVFGYTQDELAARYGYKDRASVANIMRLLQLPEHVRQMNREGRVAGSKARVLVALFTTREKHPEAAEAVETLRKGRGTYTLDRIVSMAVTDSPSALAVMVAGWTHDVEEEAARRAAAANPPLFPPSAAEDTAGETPTVEAPVAQAGITETEARAEIGRLYDVYRTADAWRTPSVQPHQVERSVVEATIETLREAERDARALIERLEHADIADLGMLVPIVNGATSALRRIQGEIQHYTMHLQNRALAIAADERAAGGQTAEEPSESVHPEPAPEAPAPRFSLDVDQVASEPAEIVQAAPIVPPSAWPVPVLDGVLVDLQKRTKAKLMEVEQAHTVPLTRPEDVDYLSSISESHHKETILKWIRQRIRFEANLVCAFALSNAQVDEVDAFLAEAWGDPNAENKHYGTSRLGRAYGSRASDSYGTMLRTLDIVPMAERGRQTYRRDAVRKLLATCYDTVRAAMEKAAAPVVAPAEPTAPAAESPAEMPAASSRRDELREAYGCDVEWLTWKDSGVLHAIEEKPGYPVKDGAFTLCGKPVNPFYTRSVYQKPTCDACVSVLTVSGRKPDDPAPEAVADVIEAAVAKPEPTHDERVEAVLAGDLSHIPQLSDAGLALIIQRAEKGTPGRKARSAAEAEKRRRFEEWQSAPAGDGASGGDGTSAIAGTVTSTPTPSAPPAARRVVRDSNTATPDASPS